MTPGRVRLAVVNPYRHGGGAEFQIDCLTRELHAAGDYEITYVARFDEDSAAHPAYAVRRITAEPLSRWGYLPDARALFAALDDIRPDIIYQRVACAYTGLCARYARRHGVRMVWHVAHDSDVTPGEHTSGRNPIRRLLEKKAIEYGLRRSDAIVVQTDEQRQRLRRHYGRDADAVVGNFHPPATESLQKSAELLVVWVANIKPIKRPDAFVRLARECRDLAGARFLMVGAPQLGGSDAAWGEAVMADIRSTPNLEYLGHRPQAEVNGLLARAQVFVNTSRQEGFPNTFIQAWLREAVVCSLDVDPDGVLDRQGCGIHAGSEPALAAAVRELAGSAQRRAELAARAKAHALRHHSLANVAQLAAVLRGKN